MAKSPAASTYARIIGEVAIAWNTLERRLDSITFMYLSLDTEVAGFILGELGNATKAELAKFLIERFEKQPAIKGHALHAVNLINRARENRNILEHAHPHAFRGSYEGTIYKINRRSNYVVFDAPMSGLKSLVQSMREAETYIRWIQHTITAQSESEDQAIAEAMLQALASLDKPPLPDKIAPLPLPQDQGSGAGPPQSSQG